MRGAGATKGIEVPIGWDEQRGGVGEVTIVPRPATDSHFVALSVVPLATVTAAHTAAFAVNEPTVAAGLRSAGFTRREVTYDHKCPHCLQPQPPVPLAAGRRLERRCVACDCRFTSDQEVCCRLHLSHPLILRSRPYPVLIPPSLGWAHQGYLARHSPGKLATGIPTVHCHDAGCAACGHCAALAGAVSRLRLRPSANNKGAAGRLCCCGAHYLPRLRARAGLP